jgi:hypothetical protein
MLDAIERAQTTTCARYGHPFLGCQSDSILGVALHTLGRQPIHGLRHRPEGTSNGWYIWAGEYSAAPDFFSPLHAAHLIEKAPEVVNYLGLPAGCRFLLADGHEDVWFDASLLI